MKFQSALFAVAVADIEPLKRLDTLVRSRFHIQKFEMNRSHSFINKGLGPREYKPIWAKIFGHVFGPIWTSFFSWFRINWPKMPMTSIWVLITAAINHNFVIFTKLVTKCNDGWIFEIHSVIPSSHTNVITVW